jgi:hypothetical protein
VYTACLCVCHAAVPQGFLSNSNACEIETCVSKNPLLALEIINTCLVKSPYHCSDRLAVHLGMLLQLVCLALPDEEEFVFPSYIGIVIPLRLPEPLQGSQLSKDLQAMFRLRRPAPCPHGFC